MKRTFAAVVLYLFAASASAAGLADITNKDAVSGLRQALTDGAAAAGEDPDVAPQQAKLGHRGSGWRLGCGRGGGSGSRSDRLRAGHEAGGN